MLARILNRMLSHDAAAAAALAKYPGRVVRLVLPVLSGTLTIQPDGTFDRASGPAEATITLSPTFFTTWLFDRDAASKKAGLNGDTELAAAVGQVLAGLRWDMAEELSQLVGDVAAHRITWLAGKIGGVPGAIGSRLLIELTEYWRDEAPLVVTKRHVDDFCDGVDTLRDDLARLEARLERLSIKSL
ncbi:sterol-binding protein [Silvimonas sp.]|uniref:ubiquinone biosynthesis accessory factor UbiJ n=1 Tax=Silvimonas sp. TaxID=2650811 RepID=UPI0028492F5E|nr:sterol-binding protein [Silvimonas sp.]MDR3428823.1 sterol-binding protein [Silvimonas sp.]